MRRVEVGLKENLREKLRSRLKCASGGPWREWEVTNQQMPRKGREKGGVED